MFDGISFDWLSSGPTDYVSVPVDDGFSFGPYVEAQSYSPGLPDGAIAPSNTANTEWYWFDQSKLSATFSDVLNAGIGAAKVALNQEIAGNNKNTGLGFFEVLRNSALDRFSSSQTGQEIRSQVLASQVRTFFQNPLAWVLVAILIILS